jgi:hypothetical protein
LSALPKPGFSELFKPCSIFLVKLLWFIFKDPSPVGVNPRRVALQPTWRQAALLAHFSQNQEKHSLLIPYGPYVPHARLPSFPIRIFSQVAFSESPACLFGNRSITDRNFQIVESRKHMGTKI